MLKLCRSPFVRFSAVSLLGLSAAAPVLARPRSEVPVGPTAAVSADALSNINHIIVIYQENWTFDGLYGSFPGANGLANASSASTTQIDRLTSNSLTSEIGQGYNIPSYVPSGSAATTAQTTNPPPPLTSDSAPGVADTRFPNGLNTLTPYTITSVTSSVDPSQLTGDIYHRYWQEQYQIAGATSINGTDGRKGDNSGFVTWSDNPGLVMSNYDATNLPEGLLAQQYTICDNFFHSAYGGSYLNHQWLVAAATNVYNNMPTSNNGNIAYLDSNGLFVLNTGGSAAGKYVRDGSITPVAGDVLSVTYNGLASSVTVGGTTTNGAPLAYPAAYYGNGSAAYDKHYVVNTTRSVNLAGNGELGIPGYTTGTTLVSLLPSQNDSNPANVNGDTRPYIPNIGDLLSQNDVSWKWYSGGFDLIKAYSGSNPNVTTSPIYSSVNASYQFQYHHQPVVYYDNYAPFDTTNTVPPAYVGGFAGYGTTGLTAGQSGVTRAQNSNAHVQDEQHFFDDVQNNTLPAVCFIKPVGVNNEHPGYAALQLGQQHVASIVQAVQNNPALWAHTAIIITYDEHGGRWDHVTPPARDIWGPGERVPCIVISPFARKGFVNSTSLDTSGILATIEARFTPGQHLNSVTGAATTLANVFTTLDIQRSGYTVNRRANTVTQTVTVTNLGNATTTGPVQLALDSLTNSTLNNATGTTTGNNAPANSPYITVTGGNLASGASATVTLQFALPSSGGITYTARTFTGSNP